MSSIRPEPPPGPRERPRSLPHVGGEVPLAWVLLLVTHATLTREMDAHLRAEHGLSLTSYEVLFALSSAPERRMRRVDLAKRLLVSQGGVTRLLAGLEKAGLVARAASDSDARVSYATLTDAGQAKLEQAARTHLADVEKSFTARYSARQLDTLADLLARLPGARAS
jgi:DNA-binding MarR family transcriptional regulator